MMRALVLGLTLAGLAACSPQPRSSSYFEAHQDEAAKVVGGRGGGRPNLAQAGGKEPAKLAEALETARKLAGQQLGA